MSPLSASKHADLVEGVNSFAGAAIEKKIAGPDNGKLYTEDDWNNEATIDKYPYHLSKVSP